MKADGTCGCAPGLYLNSLFLCVPPEQCGTDMIGIVSEGNAANTGNICGRKPCPIPFYFNQSTLECKEKCHINCETCLDYQEKSCYKCREGFYFTDIGGIGSCTSKC